MPCITVSCFSFYQCLEESGYDAGFRKVALVTGAEDRKNVEAAEDRKNVEAAWTGKEWPRTGAEGNQRRRSEHTGFQVSGRE